MDFAQLLFTTHVQMTQTSPITHNEVEIADGAIDTSDTEKMTKWLNNSYDEFKKLGLAYGSVDISPNFWLNVVILAYSERKNGSPKLLVPNGCCTTDHCPIKQFYEIAASKL